MLVPFVASLSLSNNPTTSICFTTLTINLTPVLNAVVLSKNSRPCRIMSESTVENDPLLVKHAGKVSGNGFLT